MHTNHLTRWLITAAFCLTGALATLPAQAVDGPPAAHAATILDNAHCESCHSPKDHKINVPAADGEQRALVPVDAAKFGQSVHAKMACVACHTNIADNSAPHRKSTAAPPDCASCHQALWDKAKQDGTGAAKPRLELVAKNIAAYKQSFHARPDKDNPTQPKATCTQCHDTHAFNVPLDRKGAAYAAWRKDVPALCGSACHTDQLDTYTESVHGHEVLEKNNMKAAVCIDCHTTHEITSTSLTSFKLLNVKECGNCHQDRLASYTDTYHGQATKLGNPDTAKCYNCHGSHDILPASDPHSRINPANRLKTCQSCHDAKKRPLATVGFVSFAPHANSHDFAKFPQMWIVTKFMVALLIGVFLFFWVHSGLWLYREWQERKQHKAGLHIRFDPLPATETRYFRRFQVGWRVAHLSFALVTMTLVLTGTAALFSQTTWAPAVARTLGGAHALGIIHRIAAIMFVGIFFIHFVYVMQKLLRSRTFHWFGPDSLIPNFKDARDIVGMFKWFFGKGEKPLFDRWTYFEKFDYWAVFWGVSIIGCSGLMLAFPAFTANYLPGWVFNVATVIHGEEAFLAAVFLFTVHFFNNHFRPEKLPPPDVVMFTGTQSLEEFRSDHPAQYERLLASGELEKHLVPAPSAGLTLGSKILGLTLICMGLTLLTLVAIGFFSHH